MKRLILFLLFCCALCSAQIDPTKWLVGNVLNDGGGGCFLPANATESGGFLSLTESTGSYTCAPGGSGITYATGMIFSDPFSFTYGVVKARIKFGPAPSGSGVPGLPYPSLWMWGGASDSLGYPPTCLNSISTQSATVMNGCTSGSSVPADEIDIVESKGSGSMDENYIIWTNGVQSTPCHTGWSQVDPTAAYHIYEMDWYPNSLIFKVDGGTVGTCAQSISVPMFLILDQAFGSGTGVTNVDWIRVCSDPNAFCALGDPTMIFDDEFNAGVVTTPMNHAIQGQTIQGNTIQ